MKISELVKVGVLYKKPLSIVALALLIFLFLLKQFLGLSIFSNLSENNTFLIINKFLDYTFYFSICIVIIGFGTYYFPKIIGRSKSDSQMLINVGVGIVLKGDKVLMVKRRKREGNLLWQFPAGMVKPSESSESVTINEIRKETNIDCVIRRKLGERMHPDTKIKCIYYHCEYVDGELFNLDLDENAEAKWVEIDKVKKYVTSDLYIGIEELFKSYKINNMNKIVIGIIRKNNKFLMAKRKFNEGNLSWTFPGGSVEDNETEEQAIVREIFEETDIDIRVVQKLGERIHPTTKKEISYMLCEYLDGTIKVKDNEELEKVEWMDPTEIFKKVTSDIFQPVKIYLQTYI